MPKDPELTPSQRRARRRKAMTFVGFFVLVYGLPPPMPDPWRRGESERETDQRGRIRPRLTLRPTPATSTSLTPEPQDASISRYLVGHECKVALPASSARSIKQDCRCVIPSHRRKLCPGLKCFDFARSSAPGRTVTGWTMSGGHSVLFTFAIAWTLGAALYSYYFVCRMTSRVVVEGPGEADFSEPAIYCLWHESWWPYFVAFVRYRRAHVLISDPAAYMKPVHTVFRLMGCRRVLLGSSGDEGRRAANEAAALVAKGWSTTISPDGPKGPPRV